MQFPLKKCCTNLKNALYVANTFYIRLPSRNGVLSDLRMCWYFLKLIVCTYFVCQKTNATSLRWSVLLLNGVLPNATYWNGMSFQGMLHPLNESACWRILLLWLELCLQNNATIQEISVHVKMYCIYLNNVLCFFTEHVAKYSFLLGIVSFLKASMYSVFGT
jgi:hypothetical protein